MVYIEVLKSGLHRGPERYKVEVYRGPKRYKVEDRWKWYRHCKVVISEVALDSGIIKLKQGKGKKVVQVITNLTK